MKMTIRGEGKKAPPPRSQTLLFHWIPQVFLLLVFTYYV